MLTVDLEGRVGALGLRAELPPDGGTTVIIGPNGAGKSTLLKLVLGVIAPRRGLVRLADRTLYCSDTGVAVPTEERRLGYVPQRYALFPHMTVAGNVGFGIRDGTRRERRARALSLLDDLGIAHLSDRRTPSLSGGESQRVALARALAVGPRALLLDEPTAALDATTRREVRRFLAERLRAAGVPSLVVSHDVADAEALGGRVAVLEAGEIVQVGTLDDLRRRPASPFVAQFLAARAEPAANRRRAAHTADTASRRAG